MKRIVFAYRKMDQKIKVRLLIARLPDWMTPVEFRLRPTHGWRRLVTLFALNGYQYGLTHNGCLPKEIQAYLGNAFVDNGRGSRLDHSLSQ